MARGHRPLMRTPMVGGTVREAGVRAHGTAAGVALPAADFAAQRHRGHAAEEVLRTGPIQVLVLGVHERRVADAIRAELRRLEGLGEVRLLDVLVVRKRRDGELEAQPLGGVDPPCGSGSLVRGLVGLGPGGGAERNENAGPAGDGIWYLADAIPPRATAVVALVEHRWAIPLRDAITDAGAASLAAEWIHPADLVAAGLAALRRPEPVDA